jgi:hypothetical protein
MENLILDTLLLIVAVMVMRMSCQEVEYDRVGGYNETGSYILFMTGLFLLAIAVASFIYDLSILI